LSGSESDSRTQIETGSGITDNSVLTKAREQICFNDDGNSNEIEESDSQSAKHDEPINSTGDGITIDSTTELEKASDSIRFNDDGDSNEIDESDSQAEKHDDPIIST
jgi:hypothetical protein